MNTENYLKVKSICSIFRDEFNDTSKAVMSSAFLGLIELLKREEFTAARILVNSINTPPPGITVERMEEVKALILAKIPE